jgi:hypothetical protein
MQFPKIEAVKQKGSTLAFASLKLKIDLEIVLQAIKQNNYSFVCAGDLIKSNNFRE